MASDGECEYGCDTTRKHHNIVAFVCRPNWNYIARPIGAHSDPILLRSIVAQRQAFRFVRHTKPHTSDRSDTFTRGQRQIVMHFRVGDYVIYCHFMRQIQSISIFTCDVRSQWTPNQLSASRSMNRHRVTHLQTHSCDRLLFICFWRIVKCCPYTSHDSAGIVRTHSYEWIMSPVDKTETRSRHLFIKMKKRKKETISERAINTSQTP